MKRIVRFFRLWLVVLMVGGVLAGMGPAGEVQAAEDAAAGVDPFLVEEINTTPGDDDHLEISGDQAVVMDDVLYFVTGTEAEGDELWRTDGTSDGTYLLKVFRPGPEGSTISGLTVVELPIVGNRLFFSAYTDEYGSELWRSDGTPGGTELVKDIYPGYNGSSPANLVVMGNILYFTATDETNGKELWRSNGLPGGTQMVMDINTTGSSGPINLTVVGGSMLFFSASDDGVTGNELWRSDGTPGNTILVRDIYTGTGSSSPEDLIDVNGMLFLSANDGVHGYELWRSDGTPGGTVMVADTVSGAGSFDIHYPIVYEDDLYFYGDDGVNGDEFWKYDSALGSLAMVEDIYPGASESLAGDGPVIYDGLMYFSAQDDVHNTELWRSDGTAAGTWMVKDINQEGGTLAVLQGNDSSEPDDLTVAGGLLFFGADDGINGFELWASDGTEGGTILMGDLRAGEEDALGEDANCLAELNGGLVFFPVIENNDDVEMWTSEGTPEGTQSVHDFAGPLVSSNPDYLTTMDGIAYFAADDGIHGAELWRSDGTAAGTWMVKDIYSGSSGSSPMRFVVINSTLYFTASDGTHGRELWKSDGSEGGTVLVKDLYNGSGSSSPDYMVDYNGELAFAATVSSYGSELVFSDGTEGGTYVIDIPSGSSGSSPRGLVEMGGWLYFSVSDSSGERELWRSDGTAPNTTEFYDPTPSSSSYASTLGLCRGDLIFSVNDGTSGYEPYITDGSTTGLLKDLNPDPGAGSSPGEVVEAGTNCFFVAYTSANGRELVRTDGTSGGTDIIKDIYPGANSSNIESLVDLGTWLFFTADNGSNGIELWISTGIPAGTLPVSDIVAGVGSSYPDSLAVIGDRLFFAAFQPATGLETWMLDPSGGPGSQPVRLGDIAPGMLSSAPADFTAVGNLVLFSAADQSANANRELWALSLIPDLGLDGTLNQILYAPGDEVVFTLGVENDGLEDTTGVALTSTMPAELTGLDFASNLAITDTLASPAFVWDVEDLEWGEAGDVVVTATVDASLDYEGVFTITSQITSTGGEGNISDNTIEIGIEVNLAPVLSTANRSATEGTAYTGALGSFTDPGLDDTHTATVDWGDGNATEAATVDQGAHTLSGSHTYAEDGSYTVNVTVTDSDGAVDAEAFTMTVANAAAQVIAAADQGIVEGSLLDVALATFTDAGVEDTHTATVDWGDGSATEAATVDQGAGTVSAAHAYGDDGGYTVEVTVIDDDGAQEEDSFLVTVSNANPQATPAADQTALTGEAITLTLATFTDAGVEDTYTATVNWGDGSAVEDATVDQDAGEVNGSHVYAGEGTFTVTVTVEDDDGGSMAVTFEVVVTRSGYEVFLPFTRK